MEPSSQHHLSFRKDFTYTQKVPKLISNSLGGRGEIARWVLDLNHILFVDEKHAPSFAERRINQLAGTDGYANGPVLMHTDSLIYTPRSIIEYYDLRIPEERRLFPSDAAARAEVMNWFNLALNELDPLIWKYIYTELLNSKADGKKLLERGVPKSEKRSVRWGFASIRRELQQQWEIGKLDSVVYLVEIQKIFTRVGEQLAKGNKYLCGDSFTAADLAFAAIAAPMVLPEEFGGSAMKFQEMAFELRNEIIELRAMPAGQYLMRLYQEDRPINLELGLLPKKKSWLQRSMAGVVRHLLEKQYKAFYWLQKHFPVLKLGLFKLVVVSRHDLVVDVLDRDLDFTIKEINAKKMADQKGTFFLGMDRNNPQMDRERNFAKKAARREDLERIRSFVRKESEQIKEMYGPFGKIDVVQSLNLPVLLAMLDDYFGIPAPVEAQMKKWQRSMFVDLFLNFTNNEKEHLAAVNSGKEREKWLREIIARRKNELKEGREIADNLLNRMIRLSLEEGYDWVDDDVLRRSIGGLMTGMQSTTSKAAVFALEVLFEKPDQLKAAIEAANAHDMEKMRGFVYEALRFNPVQPGVFRFAEDKQFIKGKGGKTYTIKAGRKMLVLTSGAMFDPVTFPEPRTFKPNRNARYMNWGFGLHECYGSHINSVTIPELVGAVLRLPAVRPANDDTGKGSGLMDGLFPNNYVVNFGN